MDSFLFEDSPFHNPVLRINDEHKKQKVTDLLSEFKLSPTKLVRLKKAFITELDLGLAKVPFRKSDFLMQNTFVPALPDGTESGDFLSLDLGSTNFRVCLSRLKVGEEGVFLVNYFDVPACKRKGDADILFDFLADCLSTFVNQHLPTHKETLPLAFTFSFPMIQEALDVGVLVTWTKSFDCPNAVGQNAVKLLQDAINRRGNLNIEIVAILNDTTGTLVKGAYLDPDCAVGLIMGSGGNICYLENVDKIEKWTERGDEYENVKEVIVNMECGSFGDNNSIDFAKSRFDKMLDQQSLFPGSFTFEKTFGGNFFGEIIRLVLMDLISEGLLLDGIGTEQIKLQNAITAVDVSLIERFDCQQDTSVQLLLQRLGYEVENIKPEDFEIVKFVCAIVSVRNSLLLASCLASLLERMNKTSVTIAVDGSVYKKHPKMHKLMTDFISCLAPDKKFKLMLAEDGSGKGAGLIAAIATKFRNK